MRTIFACFILTACGSSETAPVVPQIEAVIPTPQPTQQTTTVATNTASEPKEDPKTPAATIQPTYVPDVSESNSEPELQPALEPEPDPALVLAQARIEWSQCRDVAVRTCGRVPAGYSPSYQRCVSSGMADCGEYPSEVQQ